MTFTGRCSPATACAEYDGAGDRGDRAVPPGGPATPSAYTFSTNLEVMKRPELRDQGQAQVVFRHLAGEADVRGHHELLHGHRAG